MNKKRLPTDLLLLVFTAAFLAKTAAQKAEKAPFPRFFVSASASWSRFSSGASAVGWATAGLPEPRFLGRGAGWGIGLGAAIRGGWGLEIGLRQLPEAAAKTSENEARIAAAFPDFYVQNFWAPPARTSSDCGLVGFFWTKKLGPNAWIRPSAAVGFSEIAHPRAAAALKKRGSNDVLQLDFGSKNGEIWAYGWAATAGATAGRRIRGPLAAVAAVEFWAVGHRLESALLLTDAARGTVERQLFSHQNRQVGWVVRAGFALVFGKKT